MAQTTSGSLTAKSADNPDEVRQFEGKGHLDVLQLGDHTVGVGTFEPGWKWSENVKPIAKTEKCMATHLIYVISGRMNVVHEDGTELEISPGEVVFVKPGHDAWVVGDEPCRQVDFMSGATYAKR
jgi:hypothetical protein